MRLLPIAWAILGCLAAAGAGQASERMTIRIGVENNSAPLSFVDAQGRVDGFSAELLRELGQAANIDFQITAGSWSHILQEFDAGRLDALANVAITPDRQAVMDFSIGHAQMHATVFTRAADPRVTSTREFAGKKVAIVPNSLSHFSAIENGAWGTQLVFSPTRAETLRAVRDGRADLALHIRLSDDPLVRQLDLRSNLVDDLTHEFRIAVHRGDAVRLERLNDGLARLIQDEVLDRCYARWLGSIQPRAIRLVDLRPYVWPIVLGVLVITGLLIWQQRIIREREAHAKEVARLNQVYATISRVNYALVQIKDRAELLTEVCRVVVEVGGFRIAWIAWLDPETRRLLPQAVAGDKHGYVPQAGLSADADAPGGQGPSAVCFRTGRTYVCNDFFADPTTLPWRERAQLSGIRSSISLPIRLEGEIKGVLVVYSDMPGFFGRAEVTLLEETAVDISFALTVQAGEARRHRSDAMLSSILNTVPQAVFWKDQQGFYLGCNEVFARTAGLERTGDIVGKSDFDLPWERTQAEKYRADDQEVMQRNGTRRHIIEEIRSADGARRWIDTSKMPLLDKTGQVYGILGVFDDITERKKVADELVESRAQIAAVMNSTDDFIWSVDPKHFGLLTYNRAFEDYFRRSRNIHLHPGMTPEELVPPDYATRWREMFARALQDGTYVAEYEVVARTRTLLLALNVIKRGDEVFGISVFGRDITESKRMTESLKESESRFRLLIRSLNAGVVLHDASKSIVFCNEKALELLGLTREQLLGRTSVHPAWNVVDDDGAPLPGEKHPAMQVFATGEPVRDVIMGVYNPARGERTWLLASAEPLPGEPLQVMVVFHDITGLRTTEERLRLQGEALAAAANIVIISDREAKVEWVNPAFTQVTGYSFDEIVGRNPRILKSGQQPAELYADMWRKLTSGQSWTGDLVNVRKDGSLYSVESTMTPVRDRKGIITHYIAVQQDITLRKSLEKQLFETQRLESIGLLAGGIAHDLNNILSPIMLSIELLRARHPGEQKSLDLIGQCARRGADIVRQVLTFSRGLDGTKMPLKISRLMKEMGHMMSETLPRNIEFSFDLSEPRDSVLVDPTQIHQVLLNLAINARDAMPAGGSLEFKLGRESLAADSPVLGPGALPGDYVVISISDTGTGIPPEILPRIFDPFFTTKPRGQGTGLGLSTVHGIVRGHKGFIQVQSKLGSGTTFRVYLPAAPEQESASSGAAEGPAPTGQGRLILVADDERSVREITRQVLERHDFTVLTAENGEEAVELFRANQNRVWAVLLDRMMPGMGGEEAAGIIRRLAPGLPIILCTGLVTEGALLESEQELKRQGITAVLHKPFGEAALMKLLSACF